MNQLSSFTKFKTIKFPFYLDVSPNHIAQKMKFSIEDFFNKCDPIRRTVLSCIKDKIYYSAFIRRNTVPCIWSHLLKKSLMANFIFCAVPYICKQLENPVYEKKNMCVTNLEFNMADKRICRASEVLPNIILKGLKKK